MRDTNLTISTDLGTIFTALQSLLCCVILFNVGGVLCVVLAKVDS